MGSVALNWARNHLIKGKTPLSYFVRWSHTWAIISDISFYWFRWFLAPTHPGHENHPETLILVSPRLTSIPGLCFPSSPSYPATQDVLHPGLEKGSLILFLGAVVADFSLLVSPSLDLFAKMNYMGYDSKINSECAIKKSLGSGLSLPLCHLVKSHDLANLIVIAMKLVFLNHRTFIWC